MQGALIALLVFACVFGGVLSGMFVRRVLPEDHLREDTRQVIGLGMGVSGEPLRLALAQLGS